MCLDGSGNGIYMTGTVINGKVKNNNNDELSRSA